MHMTGCDGVNVDLQAIKDEEMPEVVCESSVTYNSFNYDTVD